MNQLIRNCTIPCKYVVKGFIVQCDRAGTVGLRVANSFYVIPFDLFKSTSFSGEKSDKSALRNNHMDRYGFLAFSGFFLWETFIAVTF